MNRKKPKYNTLSARPVSRVIRSFRKMTDRLSIRRKRKVKGIIPMKGVKNSII